MYNDYDDYDYEYYDYDNEIFLRSLKDPPPSERPSKKSPMSKEEHKLWIKERKKLGQEKRQRNLIKDF